MKAATDIATHSHRQTTKILTNQDTDTEMHKIPVHTQTQMHTNPDTKRWEHQNTESLNEQALTH